MSRVVAVHHPMWRTLLSRGRLIDGIAAIFVVVIVTAATVTAPLKRPFEAMAAEIMASANPPSTEASLEIKVMN